VWCITAVVGAFAARQGFRKWRGHGGTDGSASALGESSTAAEDSVPAD